MPEVTRVLMVCTGNLCRSPTAEVVLRTYAGSAGLSAYLTVDSAGTSGYQAGERPDPRAIKHGRARGYDLSKLRARRIQSADFERFHWLLAMDAENLKRLRAMAPPDSPARICLLLDYARRFVGEREVPDPYYGAPAGFERVLDLVEDACGGFLNYLVETGNFLSKA